MHTPLLWIGPKIRSLCVLMLGVTWGAAAAHGAERPSAMRLFPGESVLFVRTPDARLFGERWNETSIPRMLRDPEMKGFVQAVQGRVSDAYAEHAEEHVGIPLKDFSRLPQGEVAFALIERNNAAPGFVLLADFGSDDSLAVQAIERLKQVAQDRDAAVTDESLRNDHATIFRDGKNAERTVGIVQRGTVFVVANDKALLQSVLDRWDGLDPVELAAEEAAREPAGADVEGDNKEVVPAVVTVKRVRGRGPKAPPYTQTLADNPSFAAALGECMPGREEPPQLIGFVDPIGMVRAIGGRQTGVRVALATFPALGLTGIKGAAFASWMSTDSWESLGRWHILLENPRAGVVRIPRLEPGETSPPAFVPADIENYWTLNVDPQRTYNEVRNVVDRFQYKGRFDELVDNNVSKNIDSEFRGQVVENVTGRAIWLTGYVEGARMLGGQTAWALEVKDTEIAQGVIDRMVAKMGHAAKREFGTVTYYGTDDYDPDKQQFNPEAPPQGPEGAGGPEAEGPPLERPSPVVAIVDGFLILSTAEPFFRHLVEARDGTGPRLADALTYRLVTSRVERLSGGNSVGMLLYSNAEATIRHWHAAASAEQTKRLLDRGGDNPVALAVKDVLGENPLPPIEVLTKYLGPGGTLIYDTDTGFQAIGFSFKRGESSGGAD